MSNQAEKPGIYKLSVPRTLSKPSPSCCVPGLSYRGSQAGHPCENPTTVSLRRASPREDTVQVSRPSPAASTSCMSLQGRDRHHQGRGGRMPRSVALPVVPSLPRALYPQTGWCLDCCTRQAVCVRCSGGRVRRVLLTVSLL